MTGQPRQVRRRRRANVHSDELLLDAAAEVFHRQGFRDASMVEVAAQAGATKPTLYARFGSKLALYDRVMERVAASLLATMAAAYEGVAEDSAEQATLRPTSAFFRWVRDNPAGFHLLFTPDHGAPGALDHHTRVISALTEMIESANRAFLGGRRLRPGRTTGLLAAYFVGVMEQGARWALEHDALDRLDLGGLSSAFILRGLEGVSPEAVRTLRRRS